MEKIPGIISVGILAIVVIMMCWFYRRMIPQYTDLLVYCLLLFCYEITLLITGYMELGNHVVANINTLVYTGITLYMIINIYKRYHPRITSVRIVTISFWVVLFTAWVIENFTFGHTVFVYNSLLSGITSVIIALTCIYLLNVLMFAKTGRILKDPDVLIVAGVLMRSITFGFSLWFLNFDYGFDWQFLSNLLTGINIGLCLSDLFFLLAVQRIIMPGVWIKK